ncbi:MurR/RpiR family transcriptional regulator [Enterococcus sp. CWB-B31]|uniref:MurR/RpiR family transcriptional regulator n=1 Tax=Enterococcus sp. CWB-B31 TaxID=2885159 RepID=UPI001E3300B8|nr:MurR/RpiR family transcriptional regulator [Enterococcus sp. CWB-B31]MCB5954993.1 MurR/RpiR family transcriptional regulator [Enterococcus sp. CWB-B31]
MNILAKMAGLGSLTTNEKVLVDFILTNPKEVINCRPAELAAQAFVSVATIYRLINKLELNGIGELKIEVASILRTSAQKEEIDYDFPILESDTPFQIMQNLSNIYAYTIDETVSFADPEQLAAVGQALLKAKVIDVYAASANVFFAKNFKFQMQEIGVLINVPEEDYIQRLSAANSNKDHAAIVVSFGGRGQTVKEVVKILNKNDVEIILITSTQDNPLAEYAAHKLYLASAENHYNKVSSFSTRFSLLSIFDMLYSIYFNHNYDRNIRYKLKNYQKMNRKLE